MRRVKFRDMGPSTNRNNLWVDGYGWFHGWGMSYQAYDGGQVGTFSVAIVEDETGKIWTPLAENVSFIDTIPEYEKRFQEAKKLNSKR